MDTGGTDAPSGKPQYPGWKQYYGGYVGSRICRRRGSSGMTLMSMHNGGGTGIGNSQAAATTCLDGSRRADGIIEKSGELWRDVRSGKGEPGDGMKIR